MKYLHRILRFFYAITYEAKSQEGNYLEVKPVKWNPLIFIISLVMAIANSIMQAVSGFIAVFKEIYQ
jgi:hypothetical protein